VSLPIDVEDPTMPLTTSTGAALTAPRALIAEFLRWVAARPRTYRETMDAWRTSCPRLPVWEDALESGLVVVVRQGGELAVGITEAGRAFLAQP
jgi:hypothetical protein